MHPSIKFIHDHGAELQAEYRQCEDLNSLTPRAAEIIKQSGGLRLLLSKDAGGFEAHPVEFMRWAIAVGRYNPAAGWVAAVCGVHPYEISMMPERVREEVYGKDQDTMVSSPYAPFGRAKKVDGGYLLSGRWPYSTGTDHSDWVLIGGLETDDEGNVPHRGTPDIRHFLLPKGDDYEIVENSWKVMGLKGSGSKDLLVEDAFVPDYRVVYEEEMNEGVNARQYQPNSPLYLMKVMTVFPIAIAAGTLGIVEGFITETAKYMQSRVNLMGVAATSDQFMMSAYGRAAGDLAASIAHLEAEINKVYDHVADGGEVSVEQRITLRRDEVAAVNRCIESCNALFRLAGSQSIQERHLMEAYFRDLQVAQTHYGNMANPVQIGWASFDFGQGVPDSVFH